MTHEEVRNEILKDLPNVQRWEEHQWKEYRRKSLKMHDFPKYLFTEYKSPRKNTWLVSTKFFGKDDFSSTFGVLQIQNGLVLHQAFVSNNESSFSTICTFIPHFFERYAKYNKLNLKGKDLIKQMLKDDCSFNIDKTNKLSGRKDRDKDNNVHACMSHGVGMGYEVGYRHFLIKTYITYDMSLGKQKETFEHMRNEVVKTTANPLSYTPPLVRESIELSEKVIKKIKRKLGFK
jgi:hypothetical protein